MAQIHPPFGTQKKHTIIQTKGKQAMTQRSPTLEDAITYETRNFERWLNLFKYFKNGSKKPSRTAGSKLDFEKFFDEMMPNNMRFRWSKDENSAHHTFHLTNGNHEVFQQTDTYRGIFEKLVQHYGNNRREYFEKKYNCVLPKDTLSNIIKKGMAPPPKPIEKKVEVEVEKIIEKTVEVPIEVEKLIEVPGKTVDRLQEALVAIPLEVDDILNGNKRLPNQFRHTKGTPTVMTKGDGLIHVNIVLGP